MIKITTAADVKQAEKTKKARKPGDPNAPSFADLLETDDVSSTAPKPALHNPTYAPILADEEEQRPSTPGQLLGKLEELAADVLTGHPTAKAEELEKLLDNLPQKAGQTPAQQQVLDELATRVATTLAQLRKK